MECTNQSKYWNIQPRFFQNCNQQQINNLLTIHTRRPVRGFILAAILTVNGVPEMENLMHLKQKIITLTCVHRRQICCSLQRYTCSWDGHHGVVDLWSCSLAKSTFSLEVVRGQWDSGPLNIFLITYVTGVAGWFLHSHGGRVSLSQLLSTPHVIAREAWWLLSGIWNS